MPVFMAGRLGMDPIYRDRILRHLLDRSARLVPEDDDFREALWVLRGHHLVEWAEGRGHPLPELTPEGRALAERIARGDR